MSIIGPLNRTTTRLGAAGVDSPRTDAELLLAHVLGLPRSRLLLAEALTPAQEVALEELVSRRMGREPLQHLLGTAVLGPAEVAVGPGVFVPRPETEGLLVLALDALRGRTAPLVVDLCTGSGALALAVHLERPDADVHAVEDDPAALGWARRNLAGVTLHEADVTAPGVLADLDGTVDVVTANPPYVPDGTPVDLEVECDPRRAVFAGADGLAVIRPLAPLAYRLLRPGGVLVLEHDESHVDGVVAALAGAGFADVVTHPDLAGRPRATTARRSAAPSGPPP